MHIKLKWSWIYIIVILCVPRTDLCAALECFGWHGHDFWPATFGGVDDLRCLFQWNENYLEIARATVIIHGKPYQMKLIIPYSTVDSQPHFGYNNEILRINLKPFRYNQLNNVFRKVHSRLLCVCKPNKN